MSRTVQGGQTSALSRGLPAFRSDQEGARGDCLECAQGLQKAALPCERSDHAARPALGDRGLEAGAGSWPQPPIVPWP